MICVTVGRGRHRHMIAEHRHLAELGAKLVELRLDFIQGRVNLKRLLADRPTPVIVTCRRPHDGGKWAGSEDERVMLLRTAIVEGVEYVDLEEDTAQRIRRYGSTKRIVSLHDFRKTPDNLAELHARIASNDADIVKLATLANHPNDNLRMLDLVANSELPTVGLCMGEIGMPSRVLMGRAGAPFSYATYSSDRALAPGQLSFEQMRDLYRYEQLGPETEIYGVVGDPIAHSHSPLVHNAALAAAGLNMVYLPFRVPRPDLSAFLETAPRWGLRGLSVTIPHKESVLRILDRVDGAVRGVGAANTVVWDADGKRIGYNTDYRAAMDSLESALVEEKPPGAESALQGRKALVLGAGGAARAIAHGLHRRQAQVTICGRTKERAEQLAAKIGCRAADWDKRNSQSPDVLVNCTPVGMHPNVDESPFDKSRLRASMVVFDTVYNPENTLLIKDARQAGATVVTGIEMFVRQAALQFQLFTGQEAPQALMRDVLKRAIGPARYA